MHANDPREDLERLMRDAAEGVSVAGRPPTWEAGRPGLLPSGEPVKHRGFIDYSRCAAWAVGTGAEQRVFGGSELCTAH